MLENLKITKSKTPPPQSQDMPNPNPKESLFLSKKEAKLPPNQTQKAGPINQSVNLQGDSLAGEPATHFNHLFDATPALVNTTPSAVEPSTNAIKFADDVSFHAQNNTLAKDQFIQLYSAGFKTASGITGLQSLSMNAEEQTTIEGLGALYDSFNDIPWLRFMLSPGNKWWARGFALSALFAPMVVGVSQELEAKKQPKATATPAPEYKQKPKPEEPLEDGEPSAEDKSFLAGGNE